MIKLLLLLSTLCAYAQDTLQLYSIESIPLYQNNQKPLVIPQPQQRFYSPQIDGHHEININSSYGIDFTQNLDLHMKGPIDSLWSIDARIQERDLPLGNEGLSIPVQWIDQIWFEIYSPSTRVRLGDNSLWQPNFSIAPEQTWQGIQSSYENSSGRSNYGAQVGWGQIRSKPYSKKIIALQNNQSNFIAHNTSVRPSSESVYLNGQKMTRGKDYNFEYSTANLKFAPTRIINKDDIIEIDFYEYSLTYNEDLTTAGTWLKSEDHSFNVLVSNNEANYKNTSTDTLLYADSLKSQIKIEEWYWIENNRIINLTLKTPPSDTPIFKQSFSSAPLGRYSTIWIKTTEGIPTQVFTYDSINGNHSPSLPQQTLKNTKQAWLGQWNINTPSYDQNIHWSGHVFSKDSIDKDHAQNIYYSSALRLNKLIELKANHESYLGYHIDNKPQLGFNDWIDKWEEKADAYLLSDWHLSKIQLLAHFDPRKTSWAMAYHQLYHEDHDLYSKKIDLNFSDIKGLIHHDQSVEYLFHHNKYDSRLLVNSHQKINWSLVSPFSDINFKHYPHQDYLIWKNKMGVEKSLEKLEFNWFYLNQGDYKFQGVQTDTIQSHQFQSNSTYRPNKFDHHTLNGGVSIDLSKQTQNTSWQGEFISHINNKNNGIKNDFTYRFQNGLQQALIEKYEAVPEGTGDAIYDTLTQSWVNDVDYGNYRYLGFAYDSLAQPIETSDLNLNWSGNLTPKNLLNIKTGFIADIDIDYLFQIHQRDSSTNNFNPFHSSSTLFENVSNKKYSINWSRLNHDISFGQLWNQQSLNPYQYYSEKEQTYVHYHLDHQSYKPRLRTSYNSEKLNSSSWTNLKTEPSIWIGLGHDFYIEPHYISDIFNSNFASLAQNTYQFTIGRAWKKNRTELNSKWVHNIKDGVLPYTWHRGFKYSIGQEFILTHHSTIKEWLELNLSFYFTQYQILEETLFKMNFQMKGHF